MFHIILYLGFALAGAGAGIYIGTIMNTDPNMTMNKIHWTVRIIVSIGIIMTIYAGKTLGL